MNDRQRSLLRLAGGQLAVVVGTLHVWIGIRQWSLYATGGVFVPPDVRVPLWTVSGLALMTGVAIAFLEELASPLLYAAGALLSLVYVLGYYSWHLGGHRAFFLGGDPQFHDAGPLQFLIDHTFADPVVVVALATELSLLVVLLLLLLDALGDDADQPPGPA